MIKERKISEKIIDQMLAEGKIYEDAVKHNVIFIGYNPKGTVRYASIILNGIYAPCMVFRCIGG